MHLWEEQKCNASFSKKLDENQLFQWPNNGTLKIITMEKKMVPQTKGKPKQEIIEIEQKFINLSNFLMGHTQITDKIHTKVIPKFTANHMCFLRVKNETNYFISFVCR